MTDYLDLYRRMVLVRELEGTLWGLAKTTGEISDLHLNKGQEAISIGVTSVLRPTDYMVTSHRVISHYLGKGGKIQPLVDELLGRATGICGGRSGEMHIRDPSIGYVFSHQLVGTGVPVAVGVAWASRYVKKEDNITTLFIGDAASSNAQFLEGINAASLRKVPLLIVIEDNGLAGNITKDFYIPENTTIKDRFRAFGVGCLSVDGNKIDEVISSAKLLMDSVRSSSKPLALICETTRLTPHKIGQGDSRTPEQLVELTKRDPIVYTERLIGLTEQQISDVKTDALYQVRTAIERAHAQPWPEADEVLKSNYYQ